MKESKGFSAIVSNTGWLLGESLLRILAGLVVSIWLARFLGPENFGVLNFAIAYSGIFAIVASLGMRDVIVRDVVNEPNRSREIVSTGFILRAISGIFAYILLIPIVEYIPTVGETEKLIASIVGLAVVFQVGEVTKHYFESQVRSKYVVYVEGPVFVLSAAAKLALVYYEFPLVAFAYAVAIEAAVICLGLIVVNHLNGVGFSLAKARLSRARQILKDSWPLLLSGIAAIVYMRIDQVMLAVMSGSAAVGVYSVAVRISEVWYFVPIAIVASVFPSIITTRKSSIADYEQQLQKIYDLLVIVAVIVAIPFSLFSTWLIELLFGAAYIEAAPVLTIHAWAGVFVCLGVASRKWLIAEQLQKFALIRTAIGAVINILLNIFLIPRYGPIGAAVATIVSYSVAAFWIDAFSKKTRLVFRMKVKALCFTDIRNLMWR